MKICYSTLGLSYKGGISKLSLEIIKNMSQNNRVEKILVMCDKIDEESYNSIKNKKVSIKLIKNFVKSDFVRVLYRNINYSKMSDIFNDVQLFHALDNRAMPIFNVNMKPLVLTIHDAMVYEFFKGMKTIGLSDLSRFINMLDHYPIQWLLELLSALKVQSIIVNSPIIVDRLENIYNGLINKKIRVIPPGFDPNKFNPSGISKLKAKQFFNILDVPFFASFIMIATIYAVQYLLPGTGIIHLAILVIAGMTSYTLTIYILDPLLLRDFKGLAGGLGGGTLVRCSWPSRRTKRGLAYFLPSWWSSLLLNTSLTKKATNTRSGEYFKPSSLRKRYSWSLPYPLVPALIT